MNKLYEKHELLFALLWIAAYCVLLSVSENLSSVIGVAKCITLPVVFAMSAGLYVWLRKNRLTEQYGLCKSKVPAKKLLYHIPLVIIASVNLWFGAVMNLSALETALYVASMLFVGFLEELIFRGLLFRAMCKDNVTSAIVVSSVTFGLGHLINLFNGISGGLLETLLQIVYAMAVGFLFVTLYYRTGSLLACIATHSTVNMLSAFANETALTPTRQIVTSVVLSAVAVGYALYIMRVSPRPEPVQRTH